MIAGLLAGLADYFNQDVTVWRLAFVFLLILTGLMPGVLLYLVAWIMMPLQETGNTVEYTVYE